MKLKSFFADTIEEAIGQARRELGPDAMLVNSKRSGAEAAHLGAFEVVVCAEEPGSRPACEGRISEPHRRTMAAPPVDQLSREVSELKRQMERLALNLARSGSGMAGIASDPERTKAFAALTGAELDTDLAYELIGRLGSPLTPAALRAELARITKVEAQLGQSGASSRVVALVGPPGAGKTSALVKLAVRYGISARKPTQILTTDTYRIGAADELHSYAAILGVGCQVVESPAGLAPALEEYRGKDLILIDTPGVSGMEMEALEGLAHALANCPAIDTHLVLPASMRPTDLKRVAQQYAVFQPGKLLFTRLDETETFGPILSQSARMGKPVSFFSRGQRIPDDLEPATPDLILDLILGAEKFDESTFGAVAA